ncbi:rcc01693 family protein [Xanthobacter sp. V0B-10]|uniref:rcc01693 family protein n=1 Tax=Xanthobacter albus TaxID=3119929 RepID=UPI00372705E9
MKGGPPAATPPAFPWAEAMGLGLGILRLSPDAFWRMTPRELACAAGALAPRAAPALGRADLADLMARFPDAPAGATRHDTGARP